MLTLHVSQLQMQCLGEVGLDGAWMQFGDYASCLGRRCVRRMCVVSGKHLTERVSV